MEDALLERKVGRVVTAVGSLERHSSGMMSQAGRPNGSIKCSGSGVREWVVWKVTDIGRDEERLELQKGKF